MNVRLSARKRRTRRVAHLMSVLLTVFGGAGFIVNVGSVFICGAPVLSPAEDPSCILISKHALGNLIGFLRSMDLGHLLSLTVAGGSGVWVFFREPHGCQIIKAYFWMRTRSAPYFLC